MCFRFFRSPFHPIDIQCNPESGKFVLSGCYPIDDSLSQVEEQVYDPTNAQKVERLIVGSNLYHFDSESGVVENSNDIITNWTSHPTKFGRSIELTQQKSSGPVVVERGDIKYVGFNNSIESTLMNENLNIPSGKKGFTKIIVHRPVIGKNTNIPVSDDKVQSEQCSNGWLFLQEYTLLPTDEWIMEKCSSSTYNFDEKVNDRGNSGDNCFRRRERRRGQILLHI